MSGPAENPQRELITEEAWRVIMELSDFVRSTEVHSDAYLNFKITRMTEHRAMEEAAKHESRQNSEPPSSEEQTTLRPRLSRDHSGARFLSGFMRFAMEYLSRNDRAASEEVQQGFQAAVNLSLRHEINVSSPDIINREKLVFDIVDSAGPPIIHKDYLYRNLPPK